MRAAEFLFVVALLAAFAMRSGNLAENAGPTFDETAHLAAGISYAELNDFRMNREHPALPKWIAGKFALQSGVHCDTTRVSWMRSEQWDFARETLFEGGAPWRDVLSRGRLPFVLAGTTLGLVLWIWARKMIGGWGAGVALTLFTFCPNLIAHSALVTTDVPLTLTVVGTTACLWAAFRSGRWLWVAGASAFFAIAMVTKFSAFSYFPAYLFLAVLPSKQRPWRQAASHGLIFAASAMFLTWLAIGLTYGSFGESVTLQALGFRGRGVSLGEMGFIRRFPFEVLSRIPWPSRDFAEGLKDILLFTEAGHPVYLLGKRSDTGWWWSSFVALGAKATIGIMVLAGAGLFAALRRFRQDGAELMFLIAPPGLCLASNLAANLGLGVRHLLPLFPFAMLFAAWPLRKDGFSRGGAMMILGAILLAGHLVSSQKSRGHEIAYFNEAVGGARGGYHLLGDSNLDWGQDLPEAAERLRARGVERAVLCYFGTMNPFVLGVKWQLLPPAQREKRFDPWIILEPADPLWIVMSATNRQGIYSRGKNRRADEAPYPWIENVEPDEVVGGTVFLYEVSDDVEVIRGLVDHYLQHGMKEEAYAMLLRWAALAPQDPEAAEKLEAARRAGMGQDSSATGEPEKNS